MELIAICLVRWNRWNRWERWDRWNPGPECFPLGTRYETLLCKLILPGANTIGVKCCCCCELVPMCAPALYSSWVLFCVGPDALVLMRWSFCFWSKIDNSLTVIIDTRNTTADINHIHILQCCVLDYPALPGKGPKLVERSPGICSPAYPQCFLAYNNLLCKQTRTTQD